MRCAMKVLWVIVTITPFTTGKADKRKMMRIPSPGSVRGCMHVGLNAWCDDCVLVCICLSEVQFCMSVLQTMSVAESTMSYLMFLLSVLHSPLPFLTLTLTLLFTTDL